MAATIPPDVSLTLTIGPELDVEQLVVDTTDVLVTTAETPLLLSLGVVQGEAGYVGPPGPPGDAATCDAGSTVTLPPGSFAQVINVGSKSAAIFDFEIPQGVAGPVGPAGPMLWVPYTGSGQSFAYQNLTRDGDWTMAANKNTSDRPAPQASGAEEDLLPPWTPASLNARATYTLYNEWTLNQSGWLDQYGIDILAQNVSALHSVTLTVNGTVKDHVSFTPNGPEVFWVNITPLLVVSGAVVRVTLQVTIVANNLMYWLQQTGLFATAPSYCSLAVGSKDGAAAGTTAYGCHAMFIPGAASPDWDIVAYGGTASPGSGTAPPLADTTQDGLLRKVSGLTTDFVDGTNTCQALAPQIWSVRLRSFSAIGNPNFEIAQRNVGSTIATPTSGGFIEDRWALYNGGTLVYSAQRQTAATPVLVPGTNFAISNNWLRFAVNTTKPTLAATDSVGALQYVEGPALRELSSDVHSISLLVRSSLASLKFGVTLRSISGTQYSLAKLCTYPGPANSWQLITLPNLPVWSPSATWVYTAGSVGYYLTIGLAIGSTFIPGTNDTWIAGNFLGALGQDNFMANASATFDIAFCQHEPGPPTTLQDLDFDTNLSRCQRYYTKSYPQTIQPGSIETNANGIASCVANTTGYAVIQFKRTMAKAPTIIGYSPTTGAASNVHNASSGVDAPVSNYISVSDQGFYGFNVGSPTTNWILVYHYTADTGW